MHCTALDELASRKTLLSAKEAPPLGALGGQRQVTGRVGLATHPLQTESERKRERERAACLLSFIWWMSERMLAER